MTGTDVARQGAMAPGAGGDGAAAPGAASARHVAELVRAGTARYLERLERLVLLDSGADSPAGREAVAQAIAGWAERAGCAVRSTPSGPHGAGSSVVVAALNGRGTSRVVLLGHHDTVYPVGTAASRGFAVRGDRAYGPGVADMKGGLLLGLTVLEALAEGPRPFGVVEFHSVPDEETRPDGAFATFDRIREADACLVLECARENGDLVLARKSQCNLFLVAHGRSAHAGTHPERGRNAVLALCREALRIDALNQTAAERDGLTVTVGTLHGGTSFSVVPAEASMEVDVRAWATQDVEWAVRQVTGMGTHDGVTMATESTSLWPAMEPCDRSNALAELAGAIGRDLGSPAGIRFSGGVSDGNWTAAAGVPTLDGLGPIGGADHSPDEYIDLSSLPARAGILAAVIEAVGCRDESTSGQDP